MSTNFDRMSFTERDFCFKPVAYVAQVLFCGVDNQLQLVDNQLQLQLVTVAIHKPYVSGGMIQQHELQQPELLSYNFLQILPFRTAVWITFDL
jgi:hypothetical protein